MIEFVRIDDRLIHGQVATTWLKTQAIEQAIVISDKLAGEPIQKTVLEVAAPEGVKVHLFSTGQFIEIYHKNPIKRRTMLVFTNPMEVLRCLDGGVEIKHLNVGGMKYGPGKEKLTKAVAVDQDDKATFKKLMEQGVDVEIQMVPNDKKLNMAQFLS